jgi:hypothetical protein
VRGARVAGLGFTGRRCDHARKHFLLGHLAVTPPPVLDSAHVLQYVVVDESVAFTGKLHLYAGDERVGAVTASGYLPGLAYE